MASEDAIGTITLQGTPITDLRVTDLKLELEKRGLSKSGSKTQLVDRLKAQLLLEKLQQTAAQSSGDELEGKVPNIALQEDNKAGQSEFVRQYLLQQRKNMEIQMEMKKQIEESTRKSADDSSSTDESKTPNTISNADNKPDEVSGRKVKDGDSNAPATDATEAQEASKMPRPASRNSRNTPKGNNEKGDYAPEKILSAQPNIRGRRRKQSDSSSSSHSSSPDKSRTRKGRSARARTQREGNGRGRKPIPEKSNSPSSSSSEEELQDKEQKKKPVTPSVSRPPGSSSPAIPASQSSKASSVVRDIAPLPAGEKDLCGGLKDGMSDTTVQRPDQKNEPCDTKNETPDKKDETQDKKEDKAPNAKKRWRKKPAGVSASHESSDRYQSHTVEVAEATVSAGVSPQSDNEGVNYSEEKSFKEPVAKSSINEAKQKDTEIAGTIIATLEIPPAVGSVEHPSLLSESGSKKPLSITESKAAPLKDSSMGNKQQSGQGRRGTEDPIGKKNSKTRKRSSSSTSSSAESRSRSRSPSRKTGSQSKTSSSSSSGSDSDSDSSSSDGSTDHSDKEKKKMEVDRVTQGKDTVIKTSSSSVPAESETAKTRKDGESLKKDSTEAKQAGGKNSATQSATTVSRVNSQVEKDKHLSKDQDDRSGEVKGKQDILHTDQTVHAGKTSEQTDLPKAESSALADAEDEATAKKGTKKRKWGSKTSKAAATTKRTTSVEISTDVLKNLIGDVKLTETVFEMETEMVNTLDYDEQEEDHRDVRVKQATPQTLHPDDEPMEGQDDDRKVETRNSPSREEIELPSEPEKKIIKLSKSLPKAAVMNKKNKEEKRREPSAPDKENKEEAGNKGKKAEKTLALTRPARPIGPLIDEPQAVRASHSPPRNLPSRVIRITDLVRPFTLNQLKELLRRSGELDDEYFWMNSIKSHCLAAYTTTEEAIAARQALHNTKWPLSNPKILKVDFAKLEDVHRMKYTGDVNLPDLPIKPVENLKKFQEKRIEMIKEKEKKEKVKDLREKSSRLDREKGERDMADRKRERGPEPEKIPIREWDRDKVKQLSRSRSKSKEKERAPRRSKSRERDQRRKDRKDEDKRKEKKPKDVKTEEEPPAKLLDDLFRKTKATPCIYWLPLTEEQAQQRLLKKQEQQKIEEAAEKQEIKKRETLRLERQREQERATEKNRERAREKSRDRAREKSRERAREKSRERGQDRSRSSRSSRSRSRKRR